MKKWVGGLVLFIIISITGSIGLTETAHPLNVYLADSYLWMEVVGSASTTLTVADFQNDLQEKDLNSSVIILILSPRVSCTVLASAPHFAPDFPINHLQLKINAANQTFHNLATTPVAIGDFPGGHQWIYNISFKLTNLNQLTAAPGNYQTVVTYTAVTPALGGS